MADLAKFAANWKVSMEDMRPKGGALWVRTDDRIGAVAYALRQWGFNYKAGKGWWRE
jgi:N6-adenosine-specific RNA methylase IME4